MSASGISVSVLAVALQGAPKPEMRDGRPSHHVNGTATRFTNPWPSFRDARWTDWWRALRNWKSPVVPENVHQLIGVHKPLWSSFQEQPDKIKATWLGHACFLVELPTPPGAVRGPRILFDPVFSERCAPVQWFGPKRITPVPCPVGELPEIDVVVISHCHYDHLDRPTLKSLMFPSSQSPSTPPRVHMFAPLNNDHLFESISAPKSNYHCIDWWQSRDVTIHLPAAVESQANKITTDDSNTTSCSTAVEVKSSPTQTTPASNPTAAAAAVIKTTFRLHCTPAQHWGNRHLFDRWTTLWSSWAVESNPINPETGSAVNEFAITSESSESALPMSMPNRKVWFGGDTGYRSVRDGEDEDNVPVCPAFKQIGDAFGEFDLGLIPIGAYEPRGALSPMHCAPQDSVRVFKDIRARKAVGIHWGTWVLSAEEVMGPAERLKEECEKTGIEEGMFGVVGIGESVFV